MRINGVAWTMFKSQPKEERTVNISAGDGARLSTCTYDRMSIMCPSLALTAHSLQERVGEREIEAKNKRHIIGPIFLLGRSESIRFQYSTPTDWTRRRPIERCRKRTGPRWWEWWSWPVLACSQQSPVHQGRRIPSTLNRLEMDFLFNYFFLKATHHGDCVWSNNFIGRQNCQIANV